MARNRQRSKQRQAERRARRLEQEGVAPPEPRAGIPGVDADLPPDLSDPAAGPGPPGTDADHLEAGAPPEELGRSDFTLEHDEAIVDRDEHEAALDDDEAARLAEEEADWDAGEEYAEDFAEDDLPPEEAATGAGEAGYAVRGRRGAAAADAHKDRPRVVQFLIACWAELQRVQWPNRQALVTLTGVVLGFVLIAGGYLGLLDAIFSEVIQAIL
ncbi:MAG TPA: preprotein translocase subunit SecE [Thermoleophilaceae bacterium]|nr:preprotein translocase subunit SecE [Thermoleophilaceae bacterium]